MKRLELDPQRWARLNELLDVALELPRCERDSWLASLDERFADVKPQLSLLVQQAACIETRDFLHTLPKLDDPELSHDAAGATVGPYRLLREIGAGGMGSVWLAERIDRLPARHVALKLPHISAPRSALAERLARERDILATLEHPGIARLYDAGVSAEGRPYLALEYVEGLPLDAYCAQHPLDLRQRLELFLKIANAVAYAHAKLVVHRDLKPGNILVTRAGEVRLLDFGVAKMLDDGWAKATALTELSGRALTLDYASPEQILGAPLTTSTDVYSLGVVLFELITGQRPYRLKRDSRGALEDSILSADIRRPSDAAPETIRRALRGDLDAIVLKALKSDAQTRYATVSAFADDVARYLEQRPVLAQADGAWYRIAKFSARHRRAVASAAVASIAILGGSIVAIWQMFAAHEQRDLAIYQQQRALASSEFLTLMFDGVGSSEAALTPAALLDRGAEMLDAQYGADPRLAANMYLDVATRYAMLGRVDRQLELLDRAVEGAANIGDFELLAGAHCAIALARVQTDAVGARQAFEAARDALAKRDAAAADDITCLRARAKLEEAEGKPAASVETLQLALRKIDRAPAPSASTKIAVLTDLGEHYYVHDRAVEALATLDEIIALHERSGRRATMSNIISMMNRAAILSRMGEMLTAEHTQREAIALASRFGEENLRIEFSGHLAATLVRLSRFEEAIPLLHAVIEAAEHTGHARRAAAAQVLLATCFIRMHRFEEVDALLDAAERTWRSNVAANQRMLNELALSRAEKRLLSGDAQQAADAVESLLDANGYPHARSAGLFSMLNVAARAHLANGNFARARALAAEASSAAARVARDPSRSLDVGSAELLRAKALLGLGQRSAAAEAAGVARVALSHAVGAQHLDTRAASVLATAVLAQNRSP